MKRCFAIMDFDTSFDDIDQIIAEVARNENLEYVRSDRRTRPGSVLPQVLDDIRRSAVVVADTTGHNANVFYELGIAHQLLGPQRVIILSQKGKIIPYDVHEFRHLLYEHTEQGRSQLRHALPLAIRDALEGGPDHELWKVVHGRVPRTRLIVRDLQRLVGNTEGADASNTTIRIAAGLGSLAISDHEPADPEEPSEYKPLLLEERNALRTALVRGARLKAILNPPRRFSQRMLSDRLRVRFQRLLGLLQGRSDIVGDDAQRDDDLRAITRCELVLSPIPMPNLYIIGNRVAYEGLKRGGTRGFQKTHCETDPREINNLSQDFDSHFADSLEEMRRSHPPDGRLLEQLQGFFREATAD